MPDFKKPTIDDLAKRFYHIKPTEEQGQRMSAMREAILTTAKYCVDRTPTGVPYLTRMVR